jgi:hypothetical protein
VIEGKDRQKLGRISSLVFIGQGEDLRIEALLYIFVTELSAPVKEPVTVMYKI